MNQGAADFRQDKGQEVHALRTDDVTQHVRDAGGQHGHHGAKDHSAQRIDEKRGIDLQEGRNGDGDLLHNQTQGDHERREYQHVGVLQLGGSVTPRIDPTESCMQKLPLRLFAERGDQLQTRITRGEGQRLKAPTIRPTEYRCYIKEVIPYATAGAVTPSWNIPSSAGQTPRPDGT
ncbi:MAG: hypothetical protein BHW31_06145 [Firmicutes bacterium CAG:110_56_8]|nr:MAG: hypothetical protein BHW31_06145 [Firmicutes bacterium CAG:110_56_8]